MLLITLVYSNYLASKLKENEEKNFEMFVKALSSLSENDYDNQDDMSPYFEIIDKFPLPVILESESGELYGDNWKGQENPDSAFLAKKKAEFLANGNVPLESQGYSRYIYYFNSELLSYINYYPIVQILLVSLFVGLGYYLFNTSRKAEQNRVWAGMAKETAHQLGTPISAMMAWIEYLKDYNNEDHQYQEILVELEKDVDRLNLVADRFSKIGSHPKLTKENIYDRLAEVHNYMKRRASSKIRFDFPDRNDEPIFININAHLFDWVLENLIRNSLDAMSQEGEISAHVVKDENWVHIDLSDTGKGIPGNKFSTIFKPGFSTKERGWGLGLSLAKRIIEGYHQGKIFVKSSKLNEGTTFRISLRIEE